MPGAARTMRIDRLAAVLHRARAAGRLGWVVLACLLLAGCGFLGEEQGQLLEFSSSVRLDSAGNTVITVTVRNAGERLYTDEEELDARGEVFNEQQQLLARFTQLPVERLAAGEEATIARWQGTLEPGVYFMQWTTSRHGGVELDFTLLTRFGVLEVDGVRERKIAPDPALSP